MVQLIEDPRFETNAERVRNRSQLVELLQGRFLESTTEKWLPLLEKHDVPSAPVVWSIKDLYTNPQIVANELIMTREHPAMGWMRVPAVPWVFSRAPAQYKGVGPTIGQHQEEVLKEIGVTKKPNVNP
jgi:crotonobetainyl-CoA:carnitine CoA-transferase CaiB-like acyl-CoA transferase